MTPSSILTAIRLGETALNNRHQALLALWKKFGAEIANKRRAKGWSQGRLGKHLGYSGQMVALLEAGERTWPMDKAEKAVRLMTRPVQWPDGGAR